MTGKMKTLDELFAAEEEKAKARYADEVAAEAARRAALTPAQREAEDAENAARHEAMFSGDDTPADDDSEDDDSEDDDSSDEEDES